MMRKQIREVLVMLLIVVLSAAFIKIKAVNAEEKVITPPIIDTYSYWNEAPMGGEYELTFASGESTLIIPVQMTINGGCYIQMFNSNYETVNQGIKVPEKNYKSLHVSFYKDKACKEEVFSALEAVPLAKNYIAINNGFKADEGTYYIKYDLSREKGVDDEMTFFSYIAQISSDDKTLINDTEYVVFQDESTGTHRYKFVLDQDGYARFYAEHFWNPSSGLKLQLLNSAGKAITIETTEAGYNPKEADYTDWAFGIYKAYLLKKGTYYIQISGNCGLFYLRCTNMATTDTSGASKKSAKKLTLGQGVSATITLNDKKTKADWYQFTYKSTKTPYLVFDGISPTSDNAIPKPYDSSTGYANLTIINSDGKTVYNRKHLSLSKKTIIKNIGKKLSKGTYFIKITKEITESYGDYKLTIK